MKIKNILSFLLVVVMVATLAISCTNEDDAITISMTDVSSRITGFSNSTAGQGAPLTVSGSQLDEVVRIFVGNLVVPAKNFISVSETSLTFPIPAASALGDNEILFVFGGSERGFSEIEVTRFQSINEFTPYSASDGEVVTIVGANLDMVDEVKVGDLTASLVEEPTGGVLRFTVPDGAATGKITLVSESGAMSSVTDLISCTSATTSIDCTDGLNLNDGMELGAGDNFTNWAKQNGAGFLVATTAPGEVFRGSRALKVVRDGTLGSGQWRLQFISDGAATEIGATYTVYVWAKASTAGGSMRVSTTPNALYTGDQAVPTTWTRLAFTFTANEASTGIALDMNGNNTVATNFFIDDVKLIKN